MVRRRRVRVPQPDNARPELVALLCRMRPMLDRDQVEAELIAAETGSSWSLHLVVEAVRATGDDEHVLRLPGFRARGRTGGQPVTAEQRTAYAAHLRRRLASIQKDPDGN